MKETILDPTRPLSGGAVSARFVSIYAIGRALLEQREPRCVIETILGAIVEHLEPDVACVLAVRLSSGMPRASSASRSGR